MPVKITVTLAILVVVVVLRYVLRSSIHRFAASRQFKESRGKFIYRISRTFLYLFALLAVVSVWGVDVRNVWVLLTSVMGIVAIGFFAVWSMLSNIVAGFFLFAADPFRIDDEIVVLPEGIQGTVVDLKLMFVVLRDEKGDVLHIPNNLLFQRVVKRIAREEDAPEEDL